MVHSVDKLPCFSLHDFMNSLDEIIKIITKFKKNNKLINNKLLIEYFIF